ncbi:unnamed protein product [Psylliodes chrysocephalus]|uniref:Mediator of RNA polymerase II transcription subunit 15 n=1 Tax=Psylliodes chrysocephalus TaxID=3402493 RepID=A0A9P0CLD6_9CUCU|nr:unnamed protein product [Psylliodes chrysocephala]
MSTEDIWNSPKFRESVVRKINRELFTLIQKVNLNGQEIEQIIYDRVKSKEEYLGAIAKIITFIRTKTKTKNEDIKAQIMVKLSTLKIPKLVKVIPISELEELEKIKMEQNTHTVIADIIEEDN